MACTQKQKDAAKRARDKKRASMTKEQKDAARLSSNARARKCRANKSKEQRQVQTRKEYLAAKFKLEQARKAQGIIVTIGRPNVYTTKAMTPIEKRHCYDNRQCAKQLWQGKLWTKKLDAIAFDCLDNGLSICQREHKFDSSGEIHGLRGGYSDKETLQLCLQATKIIAANLVVDY